MLRSKFFGAFEVVKKRLLRRHGVLPMAMALAIFAPLLSAAESAVVLAGDDQVVATRGGVSVTLRDIDARVMELPKAVRGGYLNDPNRIEETIGGLLMEKQLAKRGRELGIENDPYIATQMAQAQTRYLAARARQLQEEQLQVPDFAALAEERYQANPEKYASKVSLDLTHILVSTKNRSDADAAQRAGDARERALAGEPFAKLVAEFTDEQSRSVKSNGELKDVKPGAMVPEFEKSAFALREVGDISEVVKTKFGYHVIRLDKRVEAVQPPFSLVRSQIIKELETNYRAQNKSALLDEMRGMKIEANEAVVASLRDRYTEDGPKPAAASPAVSNATQPAN